jgi:hypothetical protein
MRAPDQLDRRIQNKRRALPDEVLPRATRQPAQCCAAQCIKHSANHDGERNDERQHQERIAAAARQDAIIDLKQINGRSEKKEIVAAAVRENQAERPRAGPQGGFQRRLRR